MVNSILALLSLICGVGAMTVNDPSGVSEKKCLFERLRPETIKNIECEFGLISTGSGHFTLGHIKVPAPCFACYREVTDREAEELITRVYQRIIGCFDPPKHPLEIPVEGILSREGRPYAKIMIGFKNANHSVRIAPHPAMAAVSGVGTIAVCRLHDLYGSSEDVSEAGLSELFERYGLPKGP